MPAFRHALTGAAALALAVVAGTIFWMIGHPAITGRLALIPDALLRGEVWRAATFVVLENTPAGLVLHPFAIRYAGAALERLWGTPRFLAVTLGATVAGGLLAALAGLGEPHVRHAAFLGARPLALAIALGYGLACGRAPLGLAGWPIFSGLWTSGHALAGATVGYLGLNALFFGPIAVIPDATALAIVGSHALSRRRRGQSS